MKVDVFLYTYEAHIKIYLAKERCGGEFEVVRMGFGGLSTVAILEGVKVFAGVWRGAIQT